MPDDAYWPTPQQTFEERRQLYLQYCAAAQPEGRMAFFSQIGRLALGLPVEEKPILEGLEFVDARIDCCDFAVAGFERILFLYKDSGLIPPELAARIEDSLLRFKYWWDEPAGDNNRCYWTENHQIIFHADELLAAQLFAGQTFANDGRDSAYHAAHALTRVKRWLEFRARFGFSEWLSNCYFEEDLLALVNLYDFAAQPEIRDLARQTIDMLMYEMAMHTYRGVMGCSHGRTYPRLIKGARTEDASNTAKLMFGMGMYNRPTALGTCMLATSAYRLPPLLAKIAADLDRPQTFCERHSFDMEEAANLGLSYTDFDDAILYWSIQDYSHELTAGVVHRMALLYGKGWENYSPRYMQIRRGQEAEYGRVVDPNIDVHAMTEVHIQTYRTPSYMLSCAQDFRPGKPGYQQHPWQATLGLDAVVFTNHPGSWDETSRPNFGAGNGILPRAAQHENVLICLHRVLADDALPFAHAYFPREAFDEVLEQDGWICARKDGGYIALHPGGGYTWQADEAGKVIEVRASQPESAWIVEMGEQRAWGSFAAFCAAICGATLFVDGLSVLYTSPSQGMLGFSWHGEFRAGGKSVDLHSYKRFQNPYCTAEFNQPRFTIQRQGETLDLDFSQPS